MRPKDPIAVTENAYGTDRFAKLFTAILAAEYPDEPVVRVGGVRTEESPSRRFGLTSYATYKGETWGRVEDKKRDHYAFYPIYDWSYTDVWKAIHDGGWPYNRIYDAQYAYGVPVRSMRVSNVHHETAVNSLFYMQELEPDTYERLAARISGIDMAGKMGKLDYFPKELPFMFRDWREYRDYLLEKLIEDPEWLAGFRKRFAKQDRWYQPELGDTLYKMQVKSILTNDWEGIKLKNYEDSPDALRIRNRKVGKPGW